MKKITVITGGSSGLGLELAKQIGNLGRVCIIGKDEHKLNNALSQLNPNTIGFCGDITNENFVKSVFEKLKEQGYVVEYLFNNAGVGVFGDPDNNTKNVVDKVIDTNLKGTILTTTYAIELMEKHGGKIVNIASSAGLKGNPLESVYCASKWGVRGFTESLKAYFKGSKIKVVGVYPGGMNTSFWNDSHDYVSADRVATFMNPSDVANMIINNVYEQTVAVSDLVIDRP